MREPRRRCRGQAASSPGRHAPGCRGAWSGFDLEAASVAKPGGDARIAPFFDRNETGVDGAQRLGNGRGLVVERERHAKILGDVDVLSGVVGGDKLHAEEPAVALVGGRADEDGAQAKHAGLGERCDDGAVEGQGSGQSCAPKA